VADARLETPPEDAEAAGADGVVGAAVEAAVVTVVDSRDEVVAASEVVEVREAVVAPEADAPTARRSRS